MTSSEVIERRRKVTEQLAAQRFYDSALHQRPLSSNPQAVSERCYCGRPRRDATGRCKLEHVWPRVES